MTQRYICIHGHFYQPPRENPWLEAIELQDSAYPYHDWNERITAECYGPNSTARILDTEGKIFQIFNNYSKISFNFGPTLLAWMQQHAPQVYQAVREADQESRRLFGGHGSALAQPYNHMILPLANRRDKDTQIHWGIRDFQHRFGRRPEGMWLPETAVDLETLDLVARHGIRFTVLAPHQARRVRPLEEGKWKEVAPDQIDPSQPYRQSLSSGRSIDLFFYDGPISRAVAFEQLLTRGDNFAHRLLGAFSDARNRAQLVHIATDGETYGHHHRHGEMALAYALHYIETQNLARLTNYGEFLEKFPARQEVQIAENTSWSCAHGVERWRSDCGCSTGAHPGWNQAWREPLRSALDWLRDRLVQRFESHAPRYLKDPWEARNDYIDVILDRSAASQEAFLEKHALDPGSPEARITLLKLLEMQRHAMLMYTSCGWFFDDLSGIETVQVIQYAGRALQLAGELFGDSLEEGFVARLAKARSNLMEPGDGARIYEQRVRASRIDLLKVGAHYATSSLFHEYPRTTSVYCYQVEQLSYQDYRAGKAKLAVGTARITSGITTESRPVCFGVLHFGDHNLNGGVHELGGEQEHQRLKQETSQAFSRADFPETMRLLDRHFAGEIFSLQSLFRDEQREIVDRILDSTLAHVETEYRQIYEQHAPLMRFLGSLGIPPPKPFRMAAEFVLNSALRRALRERPLDLDQVRRLFEEARIESIPVDTEALRYQLGRNLEQLSEELQTRTRDPELLNYLSQLVDFISQLPFEVNLWNLQNAYYRIKESELPQLVKENNDTARTWLTSFLELGRKLSIRIGEEELGIFEAFRAPKDPTPTPPKTGEA